MKILYDYDDLLLAPIAVYKSKVCIYVNRDSFFNVNYINEVKSIIRSFILTHNFSIDEFYKKFKFFVIDSYDNCVSCLAKSNSRTSFSRYLYEFITNELFACHKLDDDL